MQLRAKAVLTHTATALPAVSYSLKPKWIIAYFSLKYKMLLLYVTKIFLRNILLQIIMCLIHVGLRNKAAMQGKNRFNLDLTIVRLQT